MIIIIIIKLLLKIYILRVEKFWCVDKTRQQKLEKKTNLNKKKSVLNSKLGIIIILKSKWKNTKLILLKIIYI